MANERGTTRTATKGRFDTEGFAPPPKPFAARRGGAQEGGGFAPPRKGLTGVGSAGAGRNEMYESIINTEGGVTNPFRPPPENLYPMQQNPTTPLGNLLRGLGTRPGGDVLLGGPQRQRTYEGTDQNGRRIWIGNVEQMPDGTLRGVNDLGQLAVADPQTGLVTVIGNNQSDVRQTLDFHFPPNFRVANPPAPTSGGGGGGSWGGGFGSRYGGGGGGGGGGYPSTYGSGFNKWLMDLINWNID